MYALDWFLLLLLILTQITSLFNSMRDFFARHLQKRCIFGIVFLIVVIRDLLEVLFLKRRLLAALLLCCLLAGCEQAGVPVTPAPVPQSLPDGTVYGLTAAVLYDSENESPHWQDTLDLLAQMPLLGLTAEAVDARRPLDLSGFDLVIPDAGLAASDLMDTLAGALQTYAEQGGYVLLDNAFAAVLPLDFLGAVALEKVSVCPTDLTFPSSNADLAPLQEVLSDFASLYPSYFEAAALSERDYGYGVVPGTAQTLASLGETALYTYNSYGEGGVLLTNPLLPNRFSLGNLSMTHRDEGETAFAGTTASCNMLFYSRFAGYIAKQRFGYALNRVYGFYGSPAMSWELHYEEITGIANNSMRIFSELCRQYRQIPSFTLIRSSYRWYRRAETVTYLLNRSANGLDFVMDYEESAYSSGTHIASGGGWLQQGYIDNAGSYFADYPEHNYRPYPTFGDLDGDGAAELVCGSYDGYFYCYADEGYTDRLHVSEAVRLTDPAGYPLKTPGFSAPQLVDLNGDGVLDLVSGASDGNVYWYAGDGAGRFTPMGVLLDSDIRGQVLPSFGDLNGDGVPDMALGSDQGILLLYFGQETDGAAAYSWRSMESCTRPCADAGLGSWLAPCLWDLDGDGGLDLAVGTFDGYVARLLRSDGAMTFDGYITLNEQNYKGNFNAKFGTYCVPAFRDLNGDGGLDLVCGSLEYGIAYPIDSPYFPYRAELEAQLAYAQQNDYYIGVHHYTNKYASREREDFELRRHLEAFEDYGLETSGIGTNSHTWYTSSLGDTQTFDAQFGAGLLWNSGFSPPGDVGVTPQNAAENVIALPFFLQSEGRGTILIQPNSALPYASAERSDLSGKYAMPVSIYYHCDFVYEKDASARDRCQKMADFQRKFGYVFVREDQQMRAAAAALNLRVDARMKDGVLTLTAGQAGAGFALYDARTQGAMGVEIEFSARCSAADYAVDANVWYQKGSSLYVSLDRPVTLTKAARADSAHLAQVNTPARITLVEGGAEVAFYENGMMEAVVDGAAVTSCVGWTVTQLDGKTIFTKFGGADTLRIRYEKED